MGKIIPVYFSDDEFKAFEKKLGKNSVKDVKINKSEVLKKAFFERRQRTPKVTMPTAQLVQVSMLYSKISSIIGDYQAGRDVTLALRKLQEIASEDLKGSLKK